MNLELHEESPFPVITHANQLREAVQHKEEIRFMEQPNGLTVCSYLVSAEGTFNDKMSRECRGIVFNKNGEVVSRPLHKFFNVNEKDATHVENIDWSQVDRVMIKRDGSMIHTVDVREIDDVAVFDLKSKKSFTSDVAVLAKKWMTDRENYQKFCRVTVLHGLTAVFEWTAPVSRIVLFYPEAELKLLHVRHNLTGQYMDYEELCEYAGNFDIPVVEQVDVEMFKNVDTFKIQELVSDTENMEGWVIQFKNGEMVKLKTKWYMDRHKAMTFLRERDIAEMVIEESIDDLKSKLVGDGVDISQILVIEQKVVDQLREIEREIDRLFTENKDLDRKSIAVKLQGATPYFGLVMQKYSGREPMVKEYFKRHLLPEYQLLQINLVNSVAEVE